MVCISYADCTKHTGRECCSTSVELWASLSVQGYVRTTLTAGPGLPQTFLSVGSAEGNGQTIRHGECRFKRAERLLIFTHAPPWNSSGIDNYGDVGNLQILNWGNREQLLAEVSTARWSAVDGKKPSDFRVHEAALTKRSSRRPARCAACPRLSLVVMRSSEMVMDRLDSDENSV